MPCPKKKKLQFKARIKNKFDQLLTSVARFKPGKLMLYGGTTSAQDTAPTFLSLIYLTLIQSWDCRAGKF